MATNAMALDVFDPNDYRKDVIAQIDSLTILQFNDPSLPASDSVNHVRIYCPHHDTAKALSDKGGVAVEAFGTLEDLKFSLEDIVLKNEALGIEDSSEAGYVMAFIDTAGKLHPAYSLKQALQQANNFQDETALRGVSGKSPDLIQRINRLYTGYCFGNS